MMYRLFDGSATTPRFAPGDFVDIRGRGYGLVVGVLPDGLSVNVKLAGGATPVPVPLDELDGVSLVWSTYPADDAPAVVARPSAAPPTRTLADLTEEEAVEVARLCVSYRRERADLAHRIESKPSHARREWVVTIYDPASNENSEQVTIGLAPFSLVLNTGWVKDPATAIRVLRAYRYLTERGIAIPLD